MSEQERSPGERKPAKPKKAKRGDGNTGFRVLLVVGAIVSIAIAFWGLVWTDMLENALGIEVPKRGLGVARLYGGVMLAVGIGYALAAAQPIRNRSLLVPLFIVPVATLISVVAAVARGEIPGGRGTIFLVYHLAYALLYFRFYPRLDPPSGASPPAPPSSPDKPTTTSTND